MVRMFCIRDWTTSQYGSRDRRGFVLFAIEPLPQFLLSPCTDMVTFGATLLTRDTLRDPLSSPLQSCHRRVQLLERTIPPHHSAHRCTCRSRMTSPPCSRCIPDDKWARDVHNPADPDRETSPGNAGHTGNGGHV